MKQIKGQITISEYLSSIKPCQFSGHTCNKRNLWDVALTLDDIICPLKCCRECEQYLCGARCNGSEEPERIYPVDIRGICDDAFCSKCGDGIDEFKWMDCEKCPSCGARISWEPWHRMNDEDNQELFGENWRDRFGKMTKEQGQKK